MPRRDPTPAEDLRTCGHCGYIVEYLASERCPECGNAVNTVPQRTAPAFVLLLCLTLANAGMAVTAYWEYPKTLSAWRGTNKTGIKRLLGRGELDRRIPALWLDSAGGQQLASMPSLDALAGFGDQRHARRADPRFRFGLLSIIALQTLTLHFCLPCRGPALIESGEPR
jgi:hypothetical protein